MKAIRALAACVSGADSANAALDHKRASARGGALRGGLRLPLPLPGLARKVGLLEVTAAGFRT
ncbi:MAG: hypothetical protein P4L33_00580 [Capsulimonadaceae bacterium]|nr:hypothetical protein [Capsulimonadaceae bacterium]